jgi:hypothetical protein
MNPKREITVAMPRRCRKAGCDRSGDYARELCEPCYRAVAKYVADGVVSWEQLERQGKVAQPRVTLKAWLLS